MRADCCPFPRSMLPTTFTSRPWRSYPARSSLSPVPDTIPVTPPLARSIRILLELRPALGGHAGIPQATRLLFRSLSTLDDVHVEGLLQSAERVLPRGLPARSKGF